MGFSVSSHLLRKLTAKESSMSLKIIKFCAQLKTVLGDINVDISPFANPCLVRFASVIIFFINSSSFSSGTLEEIILNS